jgi:hypothetical protein
MEPKHLAPEFPSPGPRFGWPFDDIDEDAPPWK